jgi:hypothetical protein
MALRPTTRHILAAKHGRDYPYRASQAAGIRKARAAGRGASIKAEYRMLGKQNLRGTKRV